MKKEGEARHLGKNKIASLRLPQPKMLFSSDFSYHKYDIDNSIIFEHNINRTILISILIKVSTRIKFVVGWVT